MTAGTHYHFCNRMLCHLSKTNPKSFCLFWETRFIVGDKLYISEKVYYHLGVRSESQLYQLLPSFSCFLPPSLGFSSLPSFSSFLLPCLPPSHFPSLFSFLSPPRFYSFFLSSLPPSLPSGLQLFTEYPRRTTNPVVL